MRRFEEGRCRDWDVAVVAVILAVVLLGWFTAAGSSPGAPRPAHSVAHASPPVPGGKRAGR